MDIILVKKKNHVIRVVFQDQAVYARTSFRGAITCKIGEKGCVFGHSDQFWKGHDGQIKKEMHAKMHIWGLFSYLKSMWLGCVLL